MPSTHLNGHVGSTELQERKGKQMPMVKYFCKSTLEWGFVNTDPFKIKLCPFYNIKNHFDFSFDKDGPFSSVNKIVF